MKVTQSYFVKNDSSPPRTQFSKSSYEIYLPDGAQIQGAAAMGPGGMPVASSPIPLGDPNHYAFVFPIRPGESQFQVSYTLPYSGSLKIAQKLATPVDNLVVILPKSMKFAPANASEFQEVDPGQSGQDLNAQTYVAKNVSASTSVTYTISGQGSLPRDVQASQPGAGGPAGAGAPDTPAAGSAAAQADTRPGGGLGNPIDTPDPLSKYKYWIISGLGVLLAIAAAFLFRRPVTGPVAAVAGQPASTGPMPPAGPTNVLAALKEELFTLETDRLAGKITEPEYSEHKQALEVLLKRAMQR
jgi:hypothetical protein